jgi:Ca2+-binding EF-hand superfamily protein
MKIEEFLPLFAEVKNEVKDHGTVEEFMECLRLFDKHQDGKMLHSELSSVLVTYGMLI